jgi:hypothetical protein
LENIVAFVIGMRSELKTVEYGTSVDDPKPALEFRWRRTADAFLRQMLL